MVTLVAAAVFGLIYRATEHAGMLLALLHPTRYIVFYIVDMGLVSVVLFALFERDELADRFGEEFIRYRKAVRNWAPRLVPYRQNPPRDPEQI